MTRKADIQRTTNETQISLSVDLDGQGTAKLDLQSGLGFFEHMLTALARHAAIDLSVRAVGDLHVDQHHTVEDIGICLGTAVREALGLKAGIRRYGHFTLPMEESLVTAAVDLGGRPFFVYDVEIPTPKVGDFDTELVADFWHAFAMNAKCNLHVKLHYGRNAHHIAEGVFKAIARALRMAIGMDERQDDVPSTKGVL